MDLRARAWGGVSRSWVIWLPMHSAAPLVSWWAARRAREDQRGAALSPEAARLTPSSPQQTGLTQPRALRLPGDCESGGHERETRHGRSARPRSAYARAGPGGLAARMLLVRSERLARRSPRGSRVRHAETGSEASKPSGARKESPAWERGSLPLGRRGLFPPATRRAPSPDRRGYCPRRG
jgi:hypothetical protein